MWEKETDREEIIPDQSEGQAQVGGSWLPGLLKILTWVLAAGAIAGAIVFAVRSLRKQRSKEEPQPEEEAPEIDVSDESVRADALPEDEWLALADRLAGEGDLRLALRAVFLAELAHLARLDLISLARHKSDREYLRELARRARDLPDVHQAMDWSVRTFERSWYGRHEVTNALLAEMRQYCGRVRAA